MSRDVSGKRFQNRGTMSAIPGRFDVRIVETEDDFHSVSSPDTEVRYEYAKTLITSNQSPDVPFRLSVNPYRGCEHGCIYCFARPTHAYLDLSPGIDFETRLTAKINAPEIFEKELRNPNYQCQPIALGINTDAYQPIEKELKLTQKLLNIAYEYKQPISLITKSSLILRDIDLLQSMASEHLVHVGVSLTTLDNDLSRRLEPRAVPGSVRLKMIRALRERNIPVTVMIAPVIPFINDHEMETLIQASVEAGAERVGYVMLRLPHEVAPLFEDWLNIHFPLRAERVLSHLRSMHGGQLYQGGFGKRMTGSGVYADFIRQRFHLARRKSGGDRRESGILDSSHFRLPPRCGEQIALF
ncbi:PA0069 family radical SAM protein [Vibrio gazogenes]|uniref:DNA repair photolyase n=1 Tax=Vibrio gazogenes DSM 21264 = NBRC 103151 TaxID=1123492 RepID=A0A1M4WYY3_VIBGA|nr:PA0069 family radical SAM protein [Vibrio gazogenes]USP13075.1 PA0069 family radical SAM protein [Vibrio gazogenes]SHE86458.1 DNA repair photolyase [Vibrio gazogenes DSM 21264] [Vibrio gazogenes DSM 21264 = NBRC 103151]SJN58928.1 Radical SAM superfamily protein [Vibrio gazogenes]